MKTQILDINGKKLREINLPSFFSERVREDIISKVLEAKKKSQTYSPSALAGRQHSASGKIKHRRNVWKSAYRRGISRIPRKIITRRGSQFNWIGAEIPSAVGGKRAHPPKTLSRKKKINKKELRKAMKSALSATANEKYLLKKYSSLNQAKNLPIIVDSKITKLKTKQILESLKKILGGEFFDIAIKKKKITAGKGKLRRGKYKSNAGMLLVIGKDERLRTNLFDVKNVKNLSIIDLTKTTPGRLTVYTENAIKDLEEKLK